MATAAVGEENLLLTKPDEVFPQLVEGHLFSGRCGNHCGPRLRGIFAAKWTIAISQMVRHSALPRKTQPSSVVADLRARFEDNIFDHRDGREPLEFDNLGNTKGLPTTMMPGGGGALKNFLAVAQSKAAARGAFAEGPVIAAVVVGAMLSFWLVGTETSTERWSAYLLIVGTVVAVLFLFLAGVRVRWQFITEAGFQAVVFVLTAVVLLGVAVLIAFENWDSLRQESISSVTYYLGFGLPFSVMCWVGLLLGAPRGWVSQILALRSLPLFGTYALAFSAVLVSRTGRELFGLFREEPFLVLLAGTFLSFVLGTIVWGGSDVVVSWRNRLSSRVLLLALGVLSFFLSLRGDSAAVIPGAHFHWAYFVGPVKTLRSGGTLLWDTPTQYGLGPALIPALLPFSDATIAFAVFQSLIMTATALAVLVMVFLWSHRPRQFFVLSVLFLAAFFFADPSLIGPHPYPSSSAVRFGPSLILLALVVIAAKGGVRPGRILFPVIGFSAALSFLYSAESSVYTMAILAAASGGVLALPRPRELRNILFPLWASFVATVVSGGLLAGVLVYLRTGNLVEFTMQYDAAVGYASGFGAVPVQVATPAWLVALVVGAALSQVLFRDRKGTRNRSEPVALWAAVGALVGWSTYWVGRAVNDNIVALFPLITVVAIVVVLISSRNEEELTAAPSQGSPVPALAGVMVLLAIGASVATVGAVKGSRPEIASLYSSLYVANALTGREMWSPELAEAMDALSDRQRGLPIAYEGFMGMLPERGPGSSLSMWSYDQVWIPSPLALLEEPISESRRREIFERFALQGPPEGIFVWDKSNSFVDRAALWFSLLETTHQCVVVFDSPSFEISECKVLP